MTIQFTLNGAKQSLDLDPTMPLLWALRDVLNLTGTKFGCGIGQCGACTVHLNGVAVRSCSMPVAGVANQTITTIEGLSAEGLTPLQEAWVETDVPQCGYCQVGQIMAAAAFLKNTPNPSDDDIDANMNNLCRCGTYNRIREAVKKAARTQPQPSNQPAANQPPAEPEEPKP